MAKEYDFIVIGGGIVGMATARQLQLRYPKKSVAVLEKESSAAQHQTGRNSGVIHAGVYYKPGSLKAKFCREGNIATKAFCREHGIPFEECGKLLVATNRIEHERMLKLAERCAENGIEIQVLDQQALRQREPNISGVGAILVPSTGIVNYAQVSARMGEIVRENGGEVHFNQNVVDLREEGNRILVATGRDVFEGTYLVACAGLQSDRIVSLMGIKPDFKIIPFRGEYFLLSEQHNRVVNHLIYPIPDPDLPFLGIHLTRMINGTVTVGPNAVIAFKREGYGKYDFSLTDTLEMLTYPGIIKVVLKHFMSSIRELKNSFHKAGYLRLVQKYCPSLEINDLRAHPAGIRAQAVLGDGTVVDDFLFKSTRRALAVCNAPSPAATSAIPIAGHIVDRVSEMLQQDAAQGTVK